MVRTFPRWSSPTLLPDLVCTDRDTAGDLPAPAPKLCGGAAPPGCPAAVVVAECAPAAPAAAWFPGAPPVAPTECPPAVFVAGCPPTAPVVLVCAPAAVGPGCAPAPLAVPVVGCAPGAPPVVGWVPAGAADGCGAAAGFAGAAAGLAGAGADFLGADCDAAKLGISNRRSSARQPRNRS
jgi:hypothetical protein